MGNKARDRHHRKQFMGGRMTPEEAHSKFAFPVGAKCAACQNPPLVRAIVMAPLDEMKKRDPDFEQLANLTLTNPKAAEKFFAMLVQIKGADGKPTPYVRISSAYACKQCAPEMERALAKGPSWCIVEINRGPGPDKLVTSG